jgi:hypothetical protein
MKRAAVTVATGRNRRAALEAPPCVLLAVALGAAFPSDSTGGGTNVGELTRAISVMAAAFVTLLVQAALTFQRYRFDNGLTLGTTLAAVNWYEHTARRKGLPASRVILILIATSAAALTLVLQQAACVFATSFPQPITHS